MLSTVNTIPESLSWIVDIKHEKPISIVVSIGNSNNIN